MNKKTSITLFTIILALAWSCSTNKKTKEIQPGFYQLTKTETIKTDNINIPSKLEFQSGIIHIIDDNSLEFPGQNTLGDLLWGHSQFNFKTRGKKLILTSGDFKKKVKFEITPDNLLKLETNTENMTNVYFAPLPVKLSGKYSVFGFMKKESADDEEILNVARNVFSKESFNFISDNNVIIEPAMAQIITGETVISDTIFNYSINETEITFSNSAYSVNVPYIFDGMFRLTVDDNCFQRIDLGEIKS